MREIEIIALIEAYLRVKRQQRCTAHIMIDVHMNQGGFGEPQFNILQKDSAPLMANGLKFSMEN